MIEALGEFMADPSPLVRQTATVVRRIEEDAHDVMHKTEHHWRRWLKEGLPLVKGTPRNAGPGEATGACA